MKVSAEILVDGTESWRNSLFNSLPVDWGLVVAWLPELYKHKKKQENIAFFY